MSHVQPCIVVRLLFGFKVKLQCGIGCLEINIEHSKCQQCPVIGCIHLDRGKEVIQKGAQLLTCLTVAQHSDNNHCQHSQATIISSSRVSHLFSIIVQWFFKRSLVNNFSRSFPNHDGQVAGEATFPIFFIFPTSNHNQNIIERLKVICRSLGLYNWHIANIPNSYQGFKKWSEDK